ncbi:MAG TPA: 4-hydroxy-tetrahydrodipicolinate reductase [Casimicrobiaceae bacterium]|nr:4-hydroxy-tetrahydrodipicolinate reductase [Casimicrobiaceae bacterium]
MGVTTPLKVAIAGAGGRMGQALLEAILAEPDVALVGALDIGASPVFGRDAGERLGRSTGVVVGADIALAVAGADVLLDFTRPEGTLAHLRACERARVAAVVGTTGLTATDRRALGEMAASIPIVFAPNMSVGVTVLLRLVEQAAQLLGDGYDVEIVEMHHRHKVDAPSGTALQLGAAVAQALGRDLKSNAVFGREGVTGERPREAIGFATVRGGDVVGDHSVIFAGSGERLELTHKAGSRLNFARGALRAARFVAAKRAQGLAGLFDMQDVMGIR